MRYISLIALLLATTACTSSNSGPGVDYLQSVAAVAVSNAARPAKDIEMDKHRRPADTIGFFKIEPGMQVLDIFAGGGYYTEILSYHVGETGSVTMYNNNPWDQFVQKQVAERLKGNRLQNVEPLTVEPHELDQVTRQFDAAIFILGMHDIYYEDNANGWPAIDPRKFLLNIQRLVRPGGILGIIDHNGAPGSDPAESGKTVHRVDPARVIADLEAAGFRLEEESDLLRNPNDDLTSPVFDADRRWKTDRSVLRFRRK